MSHENSSATAEIDYWRGRYEEAKSAREELHELAKLLITQQQQQALQIQQEQQQQQQLLLARMSTAPPAAGAAGSTVGRPVTISMSGVLGVLPPLLMFLFGLYGTSTGADIGTAMIIIGGIFAGVFILYILTRDRRVPSVASASTPPPANPPDTT
jgi:VIT1/CCC1 family predicted Fe2+/Mn2+ transporter